MIRDNNVLNRGSFVSQAGEEMVVISRKEYDSLIDAQDILSHDAAMAQMANRADDWLTSDEMTALLAAPTPVVFWRERRGLSQAELADGAGISRAYMSQIESGSRTGTPEVLARIARALRVSLDDLVVIDEPS